MELNQAFMVASLPFWVMAIVFGLACDDAGIGTQRRWLVAAVGVLVMALALFLVGVFMSVEA